MREGGGGGKEGRKEGEGRKGREGRGGKEGEGRRELGRGGGREESVVRVGGRLLTSMF